MSSTNRILIETFVRKTLNTIQDSPERSIRNLVELAHHFSKGRFQQRFFGSAQQMLQSEQSAYYPLARDIVNHVDHERLVRFGMNVGYNSCTLGAEIIRRIEAAEGFNIPWTLFLEIKEYSFDAHAAAYDALISQGKELGIFCWFLCAKDLPMELFDLIRKHDDCAWILLCHPDSIREAILDELNDLKHVLLSVELNEDTASMCAELRSRKLLYAVHKRYSSSDLKQILNDDLFYDAQNMGAAFTALIPDAQCSRNERELVFDYVLRKRDEQQFSTIPWDLIGDALSIDTVISEDCCSAGFRSDGSFFSIADGKQADGWNAFEHDLHTILSNLFTKQA